MEGGMIRATRFSGLAAALLFVAAVGGFGVALEGYLQSQYPVALLGAEGFPRARAFNLAAFVLPGVLACVVALGLRQRVPGDAGWPLRIGAQLLLLSALGFIGMGCLPLDPRDLDGGASRFHGTAWMLWSVAFVAAATLLGFGLWRRGEPAGPIWACLVAATVVAIAVFVPAGAIPAGVAQRVAFGTWFSWLALAGFRVSRGAP